MRVRRRRDFHTYRGYRTKELARLRDFEDERKESDAVAAWEKERADRAEEVGSKSAKRAAKRQRQRIGQIDSSGSGLLSLRSVRIRLLLAFRHAACRLPRQSAASSCSRRWINR